LSASAKREVRRGKRGAKSYHSQYIPHHNSPRDWDC
jgi:hypothetical protein